MTVPVGDNTFTLGDIGVVAALELKDWLLGERSKELPGSPDADGGAEDPSNEGVVKRYCDAPYRAASLEFGDAAELLFELYGE